jgi:hypothetical protein
MTFTCGVETTTSKCLHLCGCAKHQVRIFCATYLNSRLYNTSRMISNHDNDGFDSDNSEFPMSELVSSVNFCFQSSSLPINTQ